MHAIVQPTIAGFGTIIALVASTPQPMAHAPFVAVRLKYRQFSHDLGSELPYAWRIAGYEEVQIDTTGT